MREKHAGWFFKSKRNRLIQLRRFQGVLANVQSFPLLVEAAPDSPHHQANDPPADWDLERRREYFDWAKRVIDQLRGVHPGLEVLFDEVYSERA